MKLLNIYILETFHAFILYLLLNDSQSDTLYLIPENFYTANPILISKLRNFYVFSTEYTKSKNRCLNWFKKRILYFKTTYRIKKIKKENHIKNIYGLDHTFLGKCAICKNFILLEDGLMNYQTQEMTWRNRIKNRIPFRKRILGRDKRISKIYLTGLAPIQKEIVSKVEVVDLKILWNKKTKKEKEKILDIFGIDDQFIESLKKKRSILFTQPLSEDNVISEQEKINLYRKVLQNYEENTVAIKKHPREYTDYEKEFPEADALPGNFPAEFFTLLGIPIEKAITLFSTAVLTLPSEIEIDFYGTECHPKLFSHFGSMKRIKDRNIFL